MKMRYLLLPALLLGSILNASSSPWAESARAASDPGWAWSPSLGWLCDVHYPYIYHLEHGWLYVSGTDESSLWFYDATLHDWWWTSASLYRQDDARWTYHAGARIWLEFVGGHNPERLWQDTAGTHADDSVIDVYRKFIQTDPSDSHSLQWFLEYKEINIVPR